MLPEDDQPGWAYTVGLSQTFEHPELILFGLPLDVAHVLLNLGIWFHRRADFPMSQLFWPDRHGAMPWEARASDWQRDQQPLLYENPEAS